MEHYVTLFDSFFLPQGLALHRSLERHGGDYALWILCVDDAAFETLRKLDLPNVRPLARASFETPALLRARAERSIGEYCWTLTPFAPKAVFDHEPSAARVTYVDADLWLIRPPTPLFEEFEASGKQVLITDHAYAPEYDQSFESGRFCVQFMTFTRQGEPVRQWWADRCLEWCFARHEDGKFGDQKYLDDWPERFAPFVHVLRQMHLTLAPWNACRYPVSSAALYHFHRFRLLGPNRAEASRGYDIPRATFRALYPAYAADMFSAVDELAAVGVAVRPQGAASKPYHYLGVWFKTLVRTMFSLRPVLNIRRSELEPGR